MILLAFDTATPDTAVGLQMTDGTVTTAAHRPRAGEKPGHAQTLLELATGLLDAAGLKLKDVTRIGVGVGSGTFTGLRIGVATGRALAQATGAEVVPIATLEALVVGAEPLAEGRDVLPVLDARRGEAFVLQNGVPIAVRPEQLAELVGGAQCCLAVGDGAIRFRDMLEPSGAEIPADDSESHRVSGAALCRLARTAEPIALQDLAPDYVRAPDAIPRPR